MAYMALSAIIGSLVLLFAAAFIDGLSTCPTGQTCNKGESNLDSVDRRFSDFNCSGVLWYFGMASGELNIYGT